MHGNIEDRITIICKPNDSDNIREAKIYVKSGILEKTITVKQDAYKDDNFVSLGLPSGTKWRICNIGAESEEDYGSYLTWTEAKSALPSGCSMPTYEQAKELVDNCTWTWTSLNGVYGYRGRGPNGRTIFLPAGGIYPYSTGKLSYVGDEGDFWVDYDTTSDYSSHNSASSITFMHSAGVAPKISGQAQASRITVRCVRK